jgi:bifunctional non-homologous end joining protein LigD
VAAHPKGSATAHPKSSASTDSASTSALDPDTLLLDGYRVRFTHPDKVVYPETGTTKADILDYYRRIAPLLLPLVTDRPATRKRWIHGTGSEPFFHKNLGDDTPDWVQRRSIQHDDHVNSYPLVNDVATLAWFAQTAALEIHVPQWRFGNAQQDDPASTEPISTAPISTDTVQPDRMVFDLDPGPGAGLPDCATIARLLRSRLADHSLDPKPVTSGSKGIHLYADLDGERTADEVVELAHQLARELETERPDLVTSNIRKVNRDGRVFLDWSQNNANKTTVSPYSLRGRARPMVAAPRDWDEIDDPELQQLDYVEVLRRAGL